MVTDWGLRMGGIVRWGGSINREDHEADWGNLKRDGVTNRVIGLAVKVHRTVGPYEACLEFARVGARFERQVKFLLIYEGIRFFERAYRAISLSESRFFSK
jgi:hypothetical protein